MLLRDARYAAESWLQAHVTPGTRIGIASLTLYLPRLDGYAAHVVRPTLEATLAAQPELIVVNVEWVRRFEPTSPQGIWFSWLELGTGPYGQVFRHKDPLRGTAFAWTRRFTDGVEDPLTNLDKANPEIAIFRLKRDQAHSSEVVKSGGY